MESHVSLTIFSLSKLCILINNKNTDFAYKYNNRVINIFDKFLKFIFLLIMMRLVYHGCMYFT